MLTPGELKQISDAVSKNLTESATFQIDPEKHYKQHARIDRLLDAFDSAENAFWRWFFGLIVVGAVVSAILGAKIKGVL